MVSKQRIFFIFMQAGFGIFFGYTINYLRAFGLELPETMREFAHNLGIAGTISAIIGAFMGVFVPYILMPFIMKRVMKIRVVKKVRDWFFNLLNLE